MIVFGFFPFFGSNKKVRSGEIYKNFLQNYIQISDGLGNKQGRFFFENSRGLGDFVAFFFSLAQAKKKKKKSKL
jgi:hypothetical protein